MCFFGATTASAATYDVQDSDYGHKIVNLVSYEVQSKLNIYGSQYKEIYIVYAESTGGTKHKAVCGSIVTICNKLLANPSAFSFYADKKAKIKTDERLSGSTADTREEIIMDIKMLK